jgi:hypothetical protein
VELGQVLQEVYLRIQHADLPPGIAGDLHTDGWATDVMAASCRAALGLGWAGTPRRGGGE